MVCSLYFFESRFHVALELLLWNTSVGRVKHYFTNTNPFLKTFITLNRRPKYVATSTRLKIDGTVIDNNISNYFYSKTFCKSLLEFFINNTVQNEVFEHFIVVSHHLWTSYIHQLIKSYVFIIKHLKLHSRPKVLKNDTNSS